MNKDFAVERPRVKGDEKRCYRGHLGSFSSSSRRPPPLLKPKPDFDPPEVKEGSAPGDNPSGRSPRSSLRKLLYSDSILTATSCRQRRDSTTGT